jgi:hypothetical protein
MLAVVAASTPAGASFTGEAPVAQAVSTGSAPAPPTALSAATSCSGVLSLKAKAVLTWTATSSTFASGYAIERWKGGTLQATVHVTPRTATTYVDDGLATGTSFQWRVSAEIYLWTSSQVVTVGTTPGLCL